MAVKSDTHEMKVEVEAATQHIECKLYKRRWLILAIFVLYSMSNSMQWIQFAIIGDVVSYYYHNVDAHFINWTSMVYMITYIPLIFPASFFLDKKGLRMSAIVGAVGTCLGSWIKVGGIERDMFPVAFVGQTLVAMSQVFILSLPAQLAAVWFGPNEVSSACSIGVFGNQLGIAVGFLVPPLMVKVRDTMEETKMDFTIMFYSVAIFTTALLVLIIVFFKDHPKLPPSPAQALVRDNVENKDFKGTLIRLFTNVPYILLLISYGLNVGVFYAISTLLNQIVVMHFPGKGEDAGRIGLIMVLAGMVGSIIAGYVLDKTRRFKETTLVLYIFSLGGMILYTITLDFGDLLYVYLSGGILGFFMTGYLPVGFELAAELTYPEPEGISAGILNAAVQIFGIGLTNLDQLMVDHINDKWANIALCICLAIGIVITILIKNDLRRQRAQNTEQRTTKTEE